MVLILSDSDPLILGDSDPLILGDGGGGGATVPDSPVLSATPGTNKLTFTWTAPDDGGATITKYSLYLSGSLHTDNVTSPHEVTGLTPGVSSGPWTATATNSEGESDPSNSVTETPSGGATGAGLIYNALLSRPIGA